MTIPNFQDFVQLNDSSHLAVLGGAVVIGTGPGGKTLVFSKDDTSIGSLIWDPSTTRTIQLPDANGMLAMSSQLGAFGVSTLGNTSGTTGTVTGTVVLAGGNNITLSQSTDTNGATITISGPSAAGTAVAAIGVSTGGNTSGNTGTTVGTVVFAGIGLVTLSQSTAAGSLATITISGDAPTLRSWSFPDQPAGSFGSSNAGFSLFPVQMPVNIDATRVMILAHLTAASNSTGSVLMSFGVYTLSGSTASLASSTVRQFSWSTGTTNSTATSVYGGQSGTRYRSFDLGGTFVFTPGNYLFGFWGRSSNAGTWTFYGMDQTVSIAGGADVAETQQFLPGFSTSSFTTAMPSSINVTDTNYVRTGISAYRQPGYLLMGP